MAEMKGGVKILLDIDRVLGRQAGAALEKGRLILFHLYKRSKKS